LKTICKPEITDWAALTLIRVFDQLPGKENSSLLEGYVFVINPDFGTEARWKLPGGHKKTHSEKEPLATAMREVSGETGITIESRKFAYVGKELGEKNPHWRHFFTADISKLDLPWMNSHHPENDGERPRFFTTDEFYVLVRDHKFKEDHFNFMLAHGMIPPTMF